MTITLGPEQERLIAQAIESGAYQDPQQVIERALVALRPADDRLHEDRDWIEGKIERAFAQFERGEFYTAEASRANMEQRKAAWVAEDEFISAFSWGLPAPRFRLHQISSEYRSAGRGRGRGRGQAGGRAMA